MVHHDPKNAFSDGNEKVHCSHYKRMAEHPAEGNVLLQIPGKCDYTRRTAGRGVLWHGDDGTAYTRFVEEARETISSLVERIALDNADRELLRCDSKVISGMLFGKIKQAELRHVRVKVSVVGSFLRRSLSENDWVEVIGVLLDNALEASEAHSTVYLRAADEDGALRLTISNLSRPKSNVELEEMFRRGWSTKAGQGRGYGLYNVRRLVEQRSGKIVARNEEIGGENFLAVGVLVE